MIHALRTQPVVYSFGMKILMTLASLVLIAFAYPFLSFSSYLFEQGNLIGMLLALLIATFGLCLVAWSGVLIFRTWTSRWPFLHRGEKLLPT